MNNDLDKLERLHALFEQGALSEDEYQHEKAQILSPSGESQASKIASQTGPIMGTQPANGFEQYEEGASVDQRSNIGLLVAVLIAVIAVSGSVYWFATPSGGSGEDTQALASSVAASPTSTLTADAPIEAPMPSKASLLGKAYADALQGKPFDPAAGVGTRGGFDQTLSGPQTPSIAYQFDGKEVLIWENCMAHNCPDARSVIGVEVDGPGRFVATIIDGQTQTIKNAWFGRALLSHCAGYTCEFDTVPQAIGRQSDISALTNADLDWADGGASCRAENAAGELVFYTEGEAVIRFKGRLRRIAESDGIGVGPWSSDDGFDDSLLVEIEKRDGPSQALEEGMSYPAILTAFDGETTAVPVTMICGA